MSHKFTIEIELEDGRFCDGCPLIYSDDWGYHCILLDIESVSPIFSWEKHDGGGDWLRPRACIDRYGLGV